MATADRGTEEQRRRNRAVVTAFLQGMAASDATAIAPCVAEDVVVEQPFTGTDTPRTTTGKAALLGLVHDVATRRRGGTIAALEFADLRDPNRVMAEFRGDWTLKNGTTFGLHYVMLFWLHEGLVVRIREYYDTARIAAALSTL